MVDPDSLGDIFPGLVTHQPSCLIMTLKAGLILIRVILIKALVPVASNHLPRS